MSTEPNPAPGSAPAIVRRVLEEAAAARASDVYWLPERDSVKVRCRVNGAARELLALPRALGEQCLTHVKVLAGLLTYRTQIAQDGVLRLEHAGLEVRVASMPTVFGERLTLRLRQPETGPRLLADLGFSPACQAALRALLERPHGLLVLTGPTGCGKTTTIYALIRELLRAGQDPASIITLEDPVESVIPGVSQTAVTSEHPEWNYETALRAALRQDVKTLVVGELRDRSVVKVVLDAALTGHRVITTYHAGDIPAVYGRLLHQGFEPFLVAAAITGVLTQRLVPGVAGTPVALAAVLEPDDAWREFICASPPLGALRQTIRRYPLADLAPVAAAAAAAGAITRAQAALLTAT